MVSQICCKSQLAGFFKTAVRKFFGITLGCQIEVAQPFGGVVVLIASAMAGQAFFSELARCETEAGASGDIGGS
jgi:hypothetical protein